MNEFMILTGRRSPASVRSHLSLESQNLPSDANSDFIKSCNHSKKYARKQDLLAVTSCIQVAIEAQWQSCVKAQT